MAGGRGGVPETPALPTRDTGGLIDVLFAGAGATATNSQLIMNPKRGPERRRHTVKPSDRRSSPLGILLCFGRPVLYRLHVQLALTLCMS